MLNGLHHIGIMTADITHSIEFYKAIGMELNNPHTFPNGTQIAFLVTGSLVIELVQPADTAPLASRTDGVIDHIAITVKGIEDVIAKLRAKGVEFDNEMPSTIDLFENGCKNIFLRGPNNERLELFEEL